MVVPSTGVGPGRLQSACVSYLEGTSCGKRCRVIRSVGHETMPTFVGDWFPWNDVPELQDIYHTSMLALFTTWRNITYLKCPSESFEQAFDRFLQMADEHTIDMMANIQYQYACSNNMIRKRGAETADASIMGVSLDCEEQDQLYNISKHIQDAANDDAPTETFTQNDGDIAAKPLCHVVSDSYKLPAVSMFEGPQTELAYTAHLNTEQLMSHNIVTNHLHTFLAGRRPRQLLMLVTGQGGTGKSTMLNAITETFGHLCSSHLLKKTALSRVAASLIGGTTMHWFAGLPVQKIPQSDIWPDNSGKTIRNWC